MRFIESIRLYLNRKENSQQAPVDSGATDLRVQLFQDSANRFRADNQGLKDEVAQRDAAISQLKLEYAAKIAELESLLAQSVQNPQQPNEFGTVIALTESQSNLNLAVQIAHEQQETPAKYETLLKQFIAEVEQLPTGTDSWFSYFINIWSKEFPVSISFRFKNQNGLEQLDFLVVGNSGAEQRVLTCSRIAGAESDTFTVTEHSRHQLEKVVAFCVGLAEQCASAQTSAISILQHFDHTRTTTLMGYSADKPGILAVEQPATRINNQLNLMHQLHELGKNL